MIELNKKGLDLKNYKEIVYFKKKVKISSELKENINRNRKDFLKLLKKKKPIYSVNTGVGKLADRIIPHQKIKELQVNIIRSHAVGWGDPAPAEIVRGAILLRVNCLLKGLSGVSLELINKMVEFLNEDVTPFVPLKGSVGASGDLAPLSFIGLTIIGEGYIMDRGDVLPAYLVLKRKGIAPYTLKEKEGIALINGTQFSLSLLLHNFYEFDRLFKLSLISSVLSFVALDGNLEPFSSIIANVRNSPEQLYISKIFKKILKGYRRRGKRKNVQDPYTLRCIPQVFGAVLEVRNFIEEMISSEINAVTDNPIIRGMKAISGGNFHAQRLSFACDMMANLIATLGNFSERRVFQLMGVESSVVPRFLAKEEGLSSGYMLVQVLSAALASQNKTLSFPNSADSIPTSLNQEDFVSMSANSALRLFEMNDNLKGILITELLSAVRAISMTQIKLPPFISSLFKILEDDFKIVKEDHFIYEDIRKIETKIDSLIQKIDEVF